MTDVMCVCVDDEDDDEDEGDGKKKSPRSKVVFSKDKGFAATGTAAPTGEQPECKQN